MIKNKCFKSSIDIHLVQQKLGSVISRKHRSIRNSDITTDFRKLLQKYRINHEHAVQLSIAPPRRALPNRAHTFGTA